MAQTVSTINLEDFLKANKKIVNSRVAVALSGGPDSVCLLYLLNNIKEKYNLTLTAAHLNHKIRENEAERDMQFCIELCKKLDIPLTVESKEVLNLAQKGESVETAARRLRYEFFDSLECDYVATAHNSDDNAETVMLNILRGSGTQGGCGIPAVRNKFIRPLLTTKKCEILEYLKSNNISYVVDSTNNQNEYSRNKIRNLVFPIFSEINENYCENINRFSILLKQDQDYLKELALNEYSKAVINNELNTQLLTINNIAILSRVIMLYFKNNHLAFNKKTADAITNAIYENQNIKINIEGNLFVEYKNSILKIKTQNIQQFIVKSKIVNNLFSKNLIDCDKIVGELKITVKQNGDTIKLKGRPTKELRRIYSEKKIEPALRDLLPVARDEQGVVWGYKIGTAERVLADEKSKRILKIDVEEAINE